MDSTHDVLDLSGQVEILSYRAVFNGPYSNVYRGKLKGSDQLVAIKVLNAIHGIALHTIRRKIDRERTTWSVLRHPNILPLCGFADDHELFQPFGAFISPWRQQGDLAQYMLDYGASASMEDRTVLWKGIVAGVAYLHAHEPLLVHGDLKPRNVLIDDQGNPQLCDFGLVRILLQEGNSGMTTTTGHTGTERYLAYELVMAQEDAVPTPESDIYAVGCIGLEVVFLELPYSDRGNNLRWYILSDMQAGRPPAIRPHRLDEHSGQLWDMIAWCWQRDPVSRPDARVLLDLLAGLEGSTTPQLSPLPVPPILTHARLEHINLDSTRSMNTEATPYSDSDAYSPETPLDAYKVSWEDSMHPLSQHRGPDPSPEPSSGAPKAYKHATAPSASISPIDSGEKTQSEAIGHEHPPSTSRTSDPQRVQNVYQKYRRILRRSGVVSLDLQMPPEGPLVGLDGSKAQDLQLASRHSRGHYITSTSEAKTVGEAEPVVKPGMLDLGRKFVRSMLGEGNKKKRPQTAEELTSTRKHYEIPSPHKVLSTSTEIGTSPLGEATVSQQVVSPILSLSSAVQRKGEKKSKSDQERMEREAEKERRATLEHLQRERSRAVMENFDRLFMRAEDVDWMWRHARGLTSTEGPTAKGQRTVGSRQKENTHSNITMGEETSAPRTPNRERVNEWVESTRDTKHISRKSGISSVPTGADSMSVGAPRKARRRRIRVTPPTGDQMAPSSHGAGIDESPLVETAPSEVGIAF